MPVLQPNSYRFEFPRWRDASGGRYQIAVLLYIIGAYLCAIVALLASNVFANALGILLLAHSLVIAAFMLHECAHLSVFVAPAHNALLGDVLAWLTGACYSGFERIRRKHLRHHVERADVVAFDYRALLHRYPLLRRAVVFLEMLGVPAVELLLHAAVMLRPFIDAQQRMLRNKTLLLLSSRTVFFLLIGIYRWPALIGYAIAYVLFLQVMRFMDLFQHSYELQFTFSEESRLSEANQPRKTPRDYEEWHTFSNLLSNRRPWLNLFVLNFCYHNAHHRQPLAAWYRLPALHANYYGANCSQCVSLRRQLRWYWQYRQQRVLAPVDDNPAGPVSDATAMIGAAGVSFLTAI